ncbi:MAG: PspC domain-containing protein [Chloroflexota bacterium]|nr:MAG: PspC domain-containing protein [Chloroflexota bacterium]
MYQEDPRPGRRRLFRSTRERVWAGVCGGLAEYVDIDPTLMRVIWVAAAVLTGGLAIPAYIVMWVIMPRDEALWGAPVAPDAESPVTGSTATAATEDAGSATAKSDGLPPLPPLPRARWRPPSSPEDRERRQRAVGLLLVALGAMFFVGQLGIFSWWNWSVMWPLILVAVGVAFLIRQSDWR